jgi:hypothetical protein
MSYQHTYQETYYDKRLREIGALRDDEEGVHTINSASIARRKEIIEYLIDEIDERAEMMKAAGDEIAR